MGPPCGKLPILFPYLQGILWEWYGFRLPLLGVPLFGGPCKIPLIKGPFVVVKNFLRPRRVGCRPHGLQRPPSGDAAVRGVRCFIPTTRQTCHANALVQGHGLENQTKMSCGV